MLFPCLNWLLRLQLSSLAFFSLYPQIRASIWGFRNLTYCLPSFSILRYLKLPYDIQPFQGLILADLLLASQKSRPVSISRATRR